jgi:hypothetical protein
MFDSIQPTTLRIFIRWLVMILVAVVLSLIAVVTEPLTGLSHFWVGWVSAFVYCVIFPSLSPNYKE